jgi:hypothetical protein
MDFLRYRERHRTDRPCSAAGRPAGKANSSFIEASSGLRQAVTVNSYS